MTSPTRTTDESAGSPPDESSGSVFELKKLGRHTMIYGLGILLNKAVAFVMLPVYTRYLTPADYGVMELIEMTLDVIAIAAGARIAVGVFRYYHKVDSQPEKDAVVSTALIILSTSYATVACATLVAAPLLSELVFDSTRHTGLIRLAAVSLGFQALIIAPLAYVRIQDRSTLYVAANLAKLFIGLSLNVVLLVGMGMGVEGVFIASLSANVVVGAWLATYLVRQVGLHFSRDATRNLVRYGLPLMATQVATFIATFGDRYFLREASTVDEVGVYSLAYKFGFLLAVVGYLPFSSVWEPARFSVAEREDRDEIYARVFVLMNLLLISIAVGIILFAGDVIRVMADPSFHRAGALVPVIVVAYVLQSWANFLDLGIHVTEKTEYITLANWICAGVAVLGYWLLIPRFLGFGAAAATVVAFGIRHWVILAISQRLWHVEYRWKPVLGILALGSVAAGLSLMIPEQTSLWVSVPARSAIFLAFLATLWSSGLVEEQVRKSTVAAVGQVADRISGGRLSGWKRARAGGNPEGR